MSRFLHHWDILDLFPYIIGNGNFFDMYDLRDTKIFPDLINYVTNASVKEGYRVSTLENDSYITVASSLEDILRTAIAFHSAEAALLFKMRYC